MPINNEIKLLLVAVFKTSVESQSAGPGGGQEGGEPGAMAMQSPCPSPLTGRLHAEGCTASKRPLDHCSSRHVTLGPKILAGLHPHSLVALEHLIAPHDGGTPP